MGRLRLWWFLKIHPQAAFIAWKVGLFPDPKCMAPAELIVLAETLPAGAARDRFLRDRPDVARLLVERLRRRDG